MTLLNKVNDMDEEKKEKKESNKVVVWQHDKYEIAVDNYNWVVNGKLYFGSLERALKEVSSQMLVEKLRDRDQATINSIQALITIIKDHNSEFKQIIST